MFFTIKRSNKQHRPTIAFPFLLAAFSLTLFAFSGYGQEPAASAPENGGPAADADPVLPSTAVRAAAELKAEEQQRILGVMPNFNTTDLNNAAPLSPGQKFQLAFKGEVDPFAFVAAGFAAGISQWQKSSPSYGMGSDGYAKRFGAAYLDSFDGAMLGNALFPVMLHQDPRYFRQGAGSFGSRLYHAIASAWRTKDDNGKWTWNYSNLLGNIAAGGISNLYYSPSDRGIGPTFDHALTVTAEGAIGSVFFEFWPDMSKRLFARKKKNQDPDATLAYTE